MGEALRLLERAMDDPESRKTEAIYYNTFRAFACSLAPQTARQSQAQQRQQQQQSEDLEPPGTLDPGSSNDGLDYIDELDAYNAEDYAIGGEAAPGEYETAQDGNLARLDNANLRPEYIQAARICSTIFQTMVSHNFAIGFRTYRELIHCMLQFGMQDKARKIFEFAVDSLEGCDIKAHLILFYLRHTTRSPHQMRQALYSIMQTMPSVETAMRSLSKRTLVDQFGIFDGNLQAFVERRVRPVVEGRGGAFLAQFIFRMRKAKNAASFIQCMAAGNDSKGQFAGFNFLPLHSDGSGLAAVESEIVAACRIIGRNKAAWLRHADVIYSLLPVLPGIAWDEGESEGMSFIRKLVGSECANVGQLMALLDEAHVENYDISLVNQFLRVKYLGLTFQQYVHEKIATAPARHGGNSPRDGAMFWPSFMYAKSNGAMLRKDSSQAGLGRDGPAARLIVAAAAESWEQLASAFKRSPGGLLSPDDNTVGILSLV
ncbi:hypothetical protein GGI21_002890, partial [Coemansia aciculifera]